MSRPKIVILDAYPTNPGDLSWDGMAALGELTRYEHCPDDHAEVLRRCAGAEIVLTNKIPFDAATMDALPELRLIAVQATGYNIVDVEAARARGIAVCNVPGYSTDSVAQLTFAFILEFFSGVMEQDSAVKAGRWTASPDFVFYARPLSELSGKTLGVFGFGAIGQKVGRIGAAFGMRVLYHCRTPKTLDFASFVSREELFRKSDVLTLHAPMTAQTKGVVNRETLSWMKPGAYLVNTARGGLVDDDALAEALNAGRIAGAGIDVLTAEPPPADHPLLHARNCLVTPHVGWATHEARVRLMATLEDIVKSYLAGSPVNKVN